MENPADVGELVFESIDTPGLIKCLEVSQTGKELAENVLRHVKMEKQKLYKKYFLKAVKKKVDWITKMNVDALCLWLLVKKDTKMLSNCSCTI